MNRSSPKSRDRKEQRRSPTARRPVTKEQAGGGVDGEADDAAAAETPEKNSLGKFYITTAIDYSNGDPHLGHAFEKIGADAIARYRRLCGDDVHFLIGMDEHGLKVALEAAERGIEPKQLVDQVAERFIAMWRRLSISNDQFIRTTAPEHHAG